MYGGERVDIRENEQPIAMKPSPLKQTLTFSTGMRRNRNGTQRTRAFSVRVVVVGRCVVAVPSIDRVAGNGPGFFHRSRIRPACADSPRSLGCIFCWRRWRHTYRPRTRPRWSSGKRSPAHSLDSLRSSLSRPAGSRPPS